MELLKPDIGLIFWTLLGLVNILLCIISIVKLTKNKLTDPTTKLIWLLTIIFIPFAGSIVFLRSSAHPEKTT
jgi:Phospholipase_D-nuclease N-terminal